MKNNPERFDYVNNDFKITSKLNESNEAEVENDILDFIQNIANGYTQEKNDYLGFISSETVDVGGLLSVLNKVRLMQKLLDLSNGIIESHNIEPNSENIFSLSNDELNMQISDLNKRVDTTLINIQREHNALFDIDDYEEYIRVQKRKKKFSQYSVVFKALRDTVDGFINITAQSVPESETPCDPTQDVTKYDDVKTVNFDDSYHFTNTKPISFIFNHRKYFVKSWRELYIKFLSILYNNKNYAKFLKGLIGKPLYGNCIDFSDKKHSKELRKSVEVTPDFFAEGNLNANDLVKHIKCLLGLCSIYSSRMIIDYVVQNNDSDISEESIEENNSNDEANDSGAEIESQTEISTETKAENPAEISDISNGITLKINGKVITAYDYSNALKKVCEFSINYKPFKMARITGQAFRLGQKDVFYRTAVPVEDCNKLSNGLQVLDAASLSDLISIVEMIKRYCEMPDDMITII